MSRLTGTDDGTDDVFIGLRCSFVTSFCRYDGISSTYGKFHRWVFKSCYWFLYDDSICVMHTWKAVSVILFVSLQSEFHISVCTSSDGFEYIMCSGNIEVYTFDILKIKKFYSA